MYRVTLIARNPITGAVVYTHNKYEPMTEKQLLEFVRDNLRDNLRVSFDISHIPASEIKPGQTQVKSLTNGK